MTFPLDPYNPGIYPKREFRTPQSMDPDMLLSAGKQDVASLVLSEGKSNSKPLHVKSFQGEAPRDSKKASGSEDTHMYSLLPFSFVPMATPAQKAVLFHAMHEITASERSIERNHSAADEAPAGGTGQNKNEAGPDLVTMLSRAESGDMEGLKELTSMLNDENADVEKAAAEYSPRLAKLISGGFDKGFAQENRDHFDACRSACIAIMKRFPDLVTEEFFKSEVTPLCYCPEHADEEDISILRALWAANPQLVRSGVDFMLSWDPHSGLDWNELYNLRIAIEMYNYAPDTRTVSCLLKGLAVMPKDSAESKRFEMEQALDLLVKVKEQNPKLISAQTLEQGEPASRTLYRHLREALGKEYRADRHWQPSLTTSLLKLCFPDKILQSDLLTALETAINRRGSVNSFDEEESRILETLAVLQLDKPEERKFLNLLQGDLLVEQSHERDAWIVDRSRGRELRSGLDHIQEVAQESRLDALMRLLEISQIDKSMMNREYWSERLIPAAFPPGDQAIRSKVTDSLWNQLKEAYARAGSIGKMGRKDIAALQILECFSQDGDLPLSGKLTELLLAELRSGKTPTDGASYYVCKRLQKRRVKDNIGQIANPATQGEEKQNIINETRDLIGQIIWDRKELSNLLDETIKASSSVTEMSTALGKNSREDAVVSLEIGDDTWLVLDGIRLKVRQKS